MRGTAWLQYVVISKKTICIILVVFLRCFVRYSCLPFAFGWFFVFIIFQHLFYFQKGSEANVKHWIFAKIFIPLHLNHYLLENFCSRFFLIWGTRREQDHAVATRILGYLPGVREPALTVAVAAQILGCLPGVREPAPAMTVDAQIPGCLPGVREPAPANDEFGQNFDENHKNLMKKLKKPLKNKKIVSKKTNPESDDWKKIVSKKLNPKP